MTVVAEVVAQRVLGDVVALAAHQLPVHLGEERRGKDACGDGGTRGGHPRRWHPTELGDSPVPNSPPTERKSKAELTPAERLLKRCSWCRMPPITMHKPFGMEETPPQKKKPISAQPTRLPGTAGTGRSRGLTGTKRTQPTSVPVSADLTISA